MSAIPARGSLVGIDISGQSTTFDQGATFLLMFVVRAKYMSTDIAFWSAVVRQAGPHASPVRYWAICDTGNACPVSQSQAAITVLGHLDPYQMSAVGAADARQEALLYTSSGLLKARIACTGDARAVANRVKEAVR